MSAGNGTALAPTNGTGLARREELDPGILFSLVTRGDVSGLNTDQQIVYYNYRCKLAGLSPATRPFEYLVLQGKKVLYASKACSDGLIALHTLSVELLKHYRDDEHALYIAEARVVFPGGKHVDDIGVIPTDLIEIKGGAKRPPCSHELANIMMKAVTKAKRRAVLSACGLGDILDESELDTIREEAKPEPPKNDSGFGRGQYASPEQTAEYLKRLNGYLDAKLAGWCDFWTDRETGESELNRDGMTVAMKAPINQYQADAHLLKWAVDSGRLDPSIVPEEAKTRQLGRYTAIVYHRCKEDQRALGKEMEAYCLRQFDLQTQAIARKFPDLAGDKGIADAEFEDSGTAPEGKGDAYEGDL